MAEKLTYVTPQVRTLDLSHLTEAEKAMVADRTNRLNAAQAMTERSARLEAACRATLIFHSGKAWCELETEWEQLTGTPEATTKTLCDFVRQCLGQ